MFTYKISVTGKMPIQTAMAIYNKIATLADIPDGADIAVFDDELGILSAYKKKGEYQNEP